MTIQLSRFSFRFVQIEHHFTNLPIKSKPNMNPTQKAVWVKPNWDFWIRAQIR